MYYLGPSVAVLVTAMTFYLTPFGQTARASEGKPAVGAMTGTQTNKILSTNVPNSNATLIPRYTKKLMAAFTEYHLPPDCTQVSAGSWTVTIQPKYGTTTTGTISGHLGNGDCPSTTYTFAAIYYKWTTHNNKSKTDVFNATWKTPDGQFNDSYIFNVTVQPVRPDGETTTFTGWEDTRGLWMQKLTPPASDPNFDFSGETVQETSVGNTDNCYDGKFPFGQASLTPHQWIVGSGNTWGPDGVGWGANSGSGGGCAIEYYRCAKRTTCGFSLKQQMQISSPADNGSFTNYGGVNTLSSNIEGITFNKSGFGNITSQRADGAKQSQFWLTGPLNCPKIVDLSKCP